MKKRLNRIIFLVIALICIMVFASCKARTSSNNNSTNESEGNNSAQTQAPVTQDIQYEAELGSGYYTAGIDYPAGEYDIEAVSGSGNVSSDNMFKGGINAMMGVEEANKIGDLYEQKYSNIELPEGTVLKISGGVFVKISSDKASGKPLEARIQPNTETITLENGNFAAGEDFPAGVYDIVAVEGTGNVSSDNMLDGGINAMMGISDMEIYEKQYKNISLTEGVKLKVDGLKINLIPSI